jgi:hypothetical protein
MVRKSKYLVEKKIDSETMNDCQEKRRLPGAAVMIWTHFYCQTQLFSVIAILFNFNCLIDERDSFSQLRIFVLGWCL